MEERIAVLHDIPGRIRVHYPTLVFSQLIQLRIKRNLMELNGVTSTRIEPRIGTLTVLYDPQKIRICELIEILASFSYYKDAPQVSDKTARNWQSFQRARNRSFVSGGLLAGNYFLKLVGQPNSMLDVFSTIYTGYTVLSHGDRQKGRIHHPDILTGLITSVTLGPNKMNEVALTSWLMNLFEVYRDYQELNNQRIKE